MWSYRHRNFTVHQLPALEDNYIYLIEDHNSKALMVVDPADSSVVAAACRQLGKQLTHILNTHHHWDHTDGNTGLKSAFDCRIIGAAIDAGRIPGIDIQVVAEESVCIGGLEIRVLFLPGHTTGHIAYSIDDALFCGDVLFGGGCGRIFEGTFEQMWGSLSQIAELPAETFIYCAHEYTQNNLKFALTVDNRNEELIKRVKDTETRRSGGLPTIPSTLAVELATNPMLRPLEREFLDEYCRLHQLDSDPLAAFTHIRRRRNNF